MPARRRTGWQTPVHYWIDEAGQMRIRWDDEEGKGSLTIRSDFDGGLQSVKVFKDRKHTPYYMDANGGLHETDRARLREFVLDCANHRVLNADGRYVSAPGLTAELCSWREDCQWIKICSPATGRYAVADRRTGMITPFRYDGVQMVSYSGEDYMIVQRDGNMGVLGEGCRQLVPEQYATVSAPDGERAYFVATRNVGEYSVPRSDALVAGRGDARRGGCAGEVLLLKRTHHGRRLRTAAQRTYGDYCAGRHDDENRREKHRSRERRQLVAGFHTLRRLRSELRDRGARLHRSGRRAVSAVFRNGCHAIKGSRAGGGHRRRDVCGVFRQGCYKLF